MSVQARVALFDLETAEQCLRRGDSWIFGPETGLNAKATLGYVTFPCGYTLDADGDGINLYYGAADTSVAPRDREYHGHPWLARSTWNGVAKPRPLTVS